MVRLAFDFQLAKSDLDAFQRSGEIPDPELKGTQVQAKVAFTRISNFLEAPGLQSEVVRKTTLVEFEKAVVMESCSFSWNENLSGLNFRNVSFEVNMGEEVVICGEVGSGKSIVMVALFGQLPRNFWLGKKACESLMVVVSTCYMEPRFKQL